MQWAWTDGDDPTETFIDELFLSLTTALLGDDRSAARSAETLETARSAGAEWSIAWGQWALVLHHYVHSENRHAADLFQDALRLHRTFTNAWGYAWCTEALARTAATDSQSERVARLLGATEANLKTIGGMGGFKVFAAAHDRCEAQLRQAVGDDAYTAAVQRGADLGFDQAIAYALGRSFRRVGMARLDRLRVPSMTTSVAS